MKDTKSILKALAIQAIWWSVWAVFCAFFMYLVFKFNILSARHWAIVSKHGFTGLRGTALLISLATALPIGAAMSFLFFKQKGFRKPKKAEKPKPVEHEDKTKFHAEIEIKKDMPDELKGEYIRMKNIGAINNTPVAEPEKKVEAPKSETPKKGVMIETPNFIEIGAEPKTPAKEDDLFAMDDFDPAPKSAKKKSGDSAPTFGNFDFKPISFGGDESGGDDDIQIIETDSEIHIVAEHKDDGAWFAEEKESGGLPPQWFKEGAQKTSPAYLAKSRAEKIAAENPDKKIVPVLKITADNIINKKDMMSVWKKMGITVQE